MGTDTAVMDLEGDYHILEEYESISDDGSKRYSSK